MANIYPGEKGFKIQITIKDEDNAPVDLTGSTTVFTFFQPDGTEIVKTATVASGTAGICSYTTTDTADFTIVGSYRVQPKITLSNGNIFFGTTQTMDVASLGK